MSIYTVAPRQCKRACIALGFCVYLHPENEMNTDRDIRLVEALRGGDAEAFSLLFRKYWPRLYAYSMKFVREDDAARDIIQDCFMRLWEKKSTLTPVSIQALLFTMVRNACLNHIKYRLIHDKADISILNDMKSGTSEALYDLDFGRQPDNTTLYSELMEQIEIVLSGLPERTRQIFRMSRFEGLKNREISQKLGISATAVEKHMSRALKAFSSHFRSIYPPDLYAIVLIWTTTGIVIS